MMASQLWLAAYCRAASAIRSRSSGRSTRREQCVGQAIGGLGRLDEEAGLAASDGLADAAGPQGDDRQARRHRLEHDVAEGLGQAGEREDVGRGSNGRPGPGRS